ncbi:hypothetical protein BAE44_0017578, partial [Dichanthelium oligosanthes]
LASVRMLPWAKANINPTGQALIISTVAAPAWPISLRLTRRYSHWRGSTPTRMHLSTSKTPPSKAPVVRTLPSFRP